ncbi:TRAP transporter substrate-binding protein [Nitrincola sp. MINF-07-Sa-05]|uniref:TRAP transporter substrate-binding protein n=1 Tax=Nitrincola salilacus TaxID=3400273 RepID=UPI00391863AA
MQLHPLFFKTVIAISAAALVITAQAKELKGWNGHQPDYPVSVAMDEFGKLIAERTNGSYTPKAYHSAQLGQQDDAIELLQFGVVDFAVFNLVPLNNIVSATQATTLPYAFKSVEHMHRVMDGAVGDEIGKAMEAADMVALAWYDSGSRSFYANKPLNSIDDLKGLKIRVQNSDVNVAMVEALGANATPIPFGEVYTSIQSGVVDGAENNWPSYESTSHYQVAKYYLLDQHTIVPEVFAINKSVWNKLSDEEKAIFKQSARDSADLQRTLWAQREEKSEQIIRDSGATIVELDDKTDFINAMQPVYAEFATDPEVKDILSKIQSVE